MKGRYPEKVVPCPQTLPAPPPLVSVSLAIANIVGLRALRADKTHPSEDPNHVLGQRANLTAGHYLRARFTLLLKRPRVIPYGPTMDVSHGSACTSRGVAFPS